MFRIDTKPGLLPNLLLAAIIVTAQLGALAHAYEHEPGAPQSKVCSTCVSVAQLGFASVDSYVATVLEPQKSLHYVCAGVDVRSATIAIARQRGPPAPF